MFVVTAAGEQLQMVQAGLALEGFTVGDAVAEPPVTAPDHISVGKLADQWMRPHRLSICPLTDAGGMVTGVVTVESIRQLPTETWPLTAHGGSRCR